MKDSTPKGTGPLLCLFKAPSAWLDCYEWKLILMNTDAIIKEELMMNHPKQNEKWMCLECWQKLVAKSGETPPFPRELPS